MILPWTSVVYELMHVLNGHNITHDMRAGNKLDRSIYRNR